MRFFTRQQLGPTQSTTPEGFLLCERVPIARTGEQRYGDGEIPIEAGRDGTITIIRREEQVFRPETIASFEGKPVTLDHPSDFVTPDNWNALAVGTVQHVRQGEGVDADLLLADLLITNAAAIELVRSENGKPLREVSCGYEADYVQEAPGLGYQQNIIGNHVAIVERGRAGPRCAIQDKEPQMSTPEKKALWARIRKAFRKGDSAELENLAKADDAEETAEEKEAREKEEANAKTGDAIVKMQATIDALVASVAALTAGKTGDADEDDDEDENKGKTGDALKEVASLAEILVPGFAMPTADAATKPADALAAAQRKAITEAMRTDDGAKHVAPFLRGADLAKLTADGVAAVFNGAVELARRANNAAARPVASGATKDARALQSQIEAINKANADFYKRS